MKVWDIAASYLLLREAGGGAVGASDGFETLDAPLAADSAMDLIAYGDPRVVELVKEKIGAPGGGMRKGSAAQERHKEGAKVRGRRSPR